MPASERAVFEKLTRTPGSSLLELSGTASGGFAGYQTSADEILVFDEIQDLGGTLKVRVRHEGDECEGRSLELEKGALRPFLFGKDVGRWGVDWKRSWIMFPYDRYARKRTVEGQLIEEWNLIPCKKNINKFEFLDPGKVDVFEERFPKAWRYLCKHERELRRREDGRYEEGQAEEQLWYGATYPRNLDSYFESKLVLQLLSRRNSFAFDRDGRFVFQAGGKGGGVYGFAPGENVADLGALLAFLNSKAADFLIKQTSSVYGGRFYSYADQFLRGLPIASALLERRNSAAKQLSRIADTATRSAEKRDKLRDKIEWFPVSFERDLSRYELDLIAKIARQQPGSAQLLIDLDSVSVEKALYGYEVRFGAQRAFEFEHREHAECLAEAFRSRQRRSFPLKEVLAWRLPVKPDGCKKLLELLAGARRELRRLREEIDSLEDEMNDLVYGLYDVSAQERRVLEDFLNRYSSRPAETAENAANAGE